MIDRAIGTMSGKTDFHSAIISYRRLIIHPRASPWNSALRVIRRKQETKQEDITDVIFREIREYGESIIILDQHPHKTSVQALGNTNTRIALQTELEKDRRALAGCMMMKKEQEEWLGKLQIGYGIAIIEETENPFIIKIPKFEIKKGVVTDYMLKREFKKTNRRSSATPLTPRGENSN